MDSWNTILSFWHGLFSGVFVGFRKCNSTFWVFFFVHFGFVRRNPIDRHDFRWPTWTTPWGTRTEAFSPCQFSKAAIGSKPQLRLLWYGAHQNSENMIGLYILHMKFIQMIEGFGFSYEIAHDECLVSLMSAASHCSFWALIQRCWPSKYYVEGEKPGPLKEPEQKARKNPPEAKRSGKFMQGLETQAAWTKDVKQREAEACGLSMTVYKKKAVWPKSTFWTILCFKECQAENKAGHRPLNSYQLPKWVYHPERVNRRTGPVQRDEIIGQCKDWVPWRPNRTWESWKKNLPKRKEHQRIKSCHVFLKLHLCVHSMCICFLFNGMYTYMVPMPYIFALKTW